MSYDKYAFDELMLLLDCKETCEVVLNDGTIYCSKKLMTELFGEIIDDKYCFHGINRTTFYCVVYMGQKKCESYVCAFLRDTIKINGTKWKGLANHYEKIITTFIVDNLSTELDRSLLMFIAHIYCDNLTTMKMLRYNIGGIEIRHYQNISKLEIYIIKEDITYSYYHDHGNVDVNNINDILETYGNVANTIDINTLKEFIPEELVTIMVTNKFPKKISEESIKFLNLIFS